MFILQRGQLPLRLISGDLLFPISIGSDSKTNDCILLLYTWSSGSYVYCSDCANDALVGLCYLALPFHWHFYIYNQKLFKNRIFVAFPSFKQKHKGHYRALTEMWLLHCLLALFLKICKVRKSFEKLPYSICWENIKRKLVYISLLHYFCSPYFALWFSKITALFEYEIVDVFYQW